MTQESYSGTHLWTAANGVLQGLRWLHWWARSPLDPGAFWHGLKQQPYAGLSSSVTVASVLNRVAFAISASTFWPRCQSGTPGNGFKRAPPADVTQTCGQCRWGLRELRSDAHILRLAGQEGLGALVGQ